LVRRWLAVSQLEQAPPALSAAEKIQAAKEEARAKRKPRVNPAPKVAGGVRAAEMADLPPSLQQPPQGPVVDQEGEDTGQPGPAPQRASETGIAETVVVTPTVTAPEVPAPVVKPVVTAPVAAPVVTAPVVAVPAAVPAEVAVVRETTAGPGLPSYDRLVTPKTNMPQVMVTAFTRGLETQDELNQTVAQARQLGYPESEIQRMAAMHRWVVDLPDAPAAGEAQRS
jgi:hypothetical protein